MPALSVGARVLNKYEFPLAYIDYHQLRKVRTSDVSLHDTSIAQNGLEQLTVLASLSKAIPCVFPSRPRTASISSAPSFPSGALQHRYYGRPSQKSDTTSIDTKVR